MLRNIWKIILEIGGSCPLKINGIHRTNILGVVNGGLDLRCKMNIDNKSVESVGHQQAMLQNDALDVLKFILALLVVALHSELFPGIIYPWVRIAVPSFFVISSFLFFSRNKETQDLAGYSWRILRLYVAYFVVLLPVTIYVHRGDWFGDGFFNGSVSFLRSLICGSTFLASWFFVALLISVLVVDSLRRLFPSSIIVCLTLPLFIMTVAGSSYSYVLDKHGILNTVVTLCMEIGALRAMFWVAIGSWIADFSMRRESHILASRRVLFAVLVIGAALLYGEWMIACRRYGRVATNDWLLSLPVVVIPILMLVKDLRISCPIAKDLRLFSVVSYPMHFSIIVCVLGVLRYFDIVDAYGIVRFLVSLIAVIAGFLLIRICKKHKVPFFSWMA